MDINEIVGELLGSAAVFSSTLSSTYCQPQITSIGDSLMDSTPVGSNGIVILSLGGSALATTLQFGDGGTVGGGSNGDVNYGPGRDLGGYYDSRYGTVTKKGDDYIIEDGKGNKHVVKGNNMSYQDRRTFDESIRRNKGVFRVIRPDDDASTLNQKNYDAVDCRAERIHDMIVGDNELGKGMIIAKDSETAEVLNEIKNTREIEETIVVLKVYKEVLEKELEGNSKNKKYIKKRESR